MPGSDVLAVVTCLRDGAPLVPVTVGQILSGREASVILRCSECHVDHHLYVSLNLFSKFIDTNPDNQCRPAECGTESGYSKHRRNGTPICEMCASAHREGNRRRAKREPVAV